MKTKILLFFAFILILASSIWAIARYKAGPTLRGNTTIATSFYPLAHFTKQIVGDKKTVINITPNGAEPHEYAPTPQDIAKANEANLFIFNGAGVDSWAQKAAISIPAKKILEIATHFSLLHSSHNSESTNDPHIWLDPVLAKEEVKLIQNKLIEIEPENKDLYTYNANNYLKQLDDLDNDYKTGLASCSAREIVVMHNAFSYLEKRYNFTSHYLNDLSSEEEPTSQDVAKIVELVKKNKWSYVFTEKLMNSKFSDTIAKETGAEVKVLSPIEGLTPEEQARGESYISVMEENLINLRQAMNCK